MTNFIFGFVSCFGVIALIAIVQLIRILKEAYNEAVREIEEENKI